jgi:cytochrome c peroxidase
VFLQDAFSGDSQTKYWLFHKGVFLFPKGGPPQNHLRCFRLFLSCIEEVQMKGKKFLTATFFVAIGLVLIISIVSAAAGPESMEELGKAIFFDENLSANGDQSCASCHAPEAGWTGPDSYVNAHGAVYEGSIDNAFGDRKPPSAAYATFSPVFHVDKKGLFTGGNFWDGRATGEKLGNPAADQAQGPFLNPKEQALPSADVLVERVCSASYGDLFRDVWGDEMCDPSNVNAAYDAIGLSIAAYEASSEVNAFTSKYDYTFTGQAKLTKEEQRGFALFQGKGKCRLCHTSGKDALFTDFTFDNLGIPQNPENPAGVAPDFVDLGLGGFLSTRPEYAEYADDNMGMHKVPTLRNVDLRPSIDFVKAYGHNGYFKTLEGIVHFYNTRDVLPTCSGPYTEAEALENKCWPKPEVSENVNTAELGDLGLTPDEEAAIVAFLRTLSDGYKP